MTRKEAIKELSYIADEMPSMECADWKEAISIAIKSLEQEPKIEVLDKIRTEIDKHKSTIDKAISEDELKIEGMKEAYTDCLEIINKCKAESEKV